MNSIFSCALILFIWLVYSKTARYTSLIIWLDKSGYFFVVTMTVFNPDLLFSDKEIFVTLTYPNEISESDYVLLNNNKIYLNNKLTFIAIKNGMHDSIGYYYASFKKYAGKTTTDLRNIHNIILNFFNKTIT